ncbi:hypothetical protein RUM44_007821 [Polyplax serrata]|uniref:protein-serine/threonine phosphatase n=1 Tax=Polyplax serrata TaxID=468196 RepID=A0ABR1B8E9_POLSC
MGLSLGAYLSHPITEKHSSNEENSKMIYGVSSMQGWRETQEDAHNCILDFDGDCSLFAVYDGHGGNEVSEYTSQHLPAFIKDSEFYKNGDYESALKDSFVKFDCTLKEPEVVEVLKKLAKYNEGMGEDDSESDDDNLGNLKAEAKMTIEEVMAKYVSSHKEDKKNNSEVIQSSDKVSTKDCSKFSEVSSNETECSSSKTNVCFNESDSEVSSSSSSCAVTRKSLSEKYNTNGKLSKSILDSTSNGEDALNSSGSSQVDKVNTSVSSDSSVAPSKAQSGSKKGSREGITSNLSTTEEGEAVTCNGETQSKTVEETISSSVENGEGEGAKSKGKGKALVKHQPKVKEEKEKESSEKLFQKFINSESNDEIIESDSDDVTFNGPESDDDDDDDDDEDGEGDEEEDDDDEDDIDEEDDDSEDYEYENEVDRCFMEPGSESGCTALVALIKNNKLYVANAGDCRCVVSKNGEAIEMSLDHKPENDIELQRIEKAGGSVTAGRVNAGLNLSRALGDHVYKRTVGLPPEEQMISPLPDIQVLDLEPDIEFMVLACDGIWNSMSSKEVIDFVRPRLLENSGNLSKICEELFDHCLAPNTLCDGTGCDNMTAIIVQFKDSKFSTLRKKRQLEEESSEAEECIKKKQKTEDVTSTDSVGSSQQSAEDGFPEQSSNSPDTTQ